MENQLSPKSLGLRPNPDILNGLPLAIFLHNNIIRNKDSFKHIYGITTGLGLNYQTKTALSLL